MKHKILSLVLLFIFTQTDADNFAPLHTIFATPGNQYGGPGTTLNFIAYLCGGEAFDKKVATVTLNQPSHEWSIDKGYWLKVWAYNNKGETVGNNNITSDIHSLTQSFSFPYSSTDGDLRFRVLTGRGTGAHTFTFAMTFDDKSPSTSNNRAIRHVVTEQEIFEVRRQERLMTELTGEQVTYTQLLQIFKIQGNGTVTTTEYDFYRMDYCFFPVQPSHPYNVTVTVVALDGQSAFGLYLCTASLLKCNINSVPKELTDNTGTAACFVSAQLYQKDYGTLKAIIQGNGRFGQNNTFVITASAFEPVDMPFLV